MKPVTHDCEFGGTPLRWSIFAPQRTPKKTKQQRLYEAMLMPEGERVEAFIKEAKKR